MTHKTKKTQKTVETIRHDDASRKNIPTAEYQSVMREDEKDPIRVAYERRNRDLDPQLVWRGKDEQDWSDLGRSGFKSRPLESRESILVLTNYTPSFPRSAWERRTPSITRKCKLRHSLLEGCRFLHEKVARAEMQRIRGSRGFQKEDEIEGARKNITQ